MDEVDVLLHPLKSVSRPEQLETPWGGDVKIISPWFWWRFCFWFGGGGLAGGGLVVHQRHPTICLNPKSELPLGKIILT